MKLVLLPGLNGTGQLFDPLLRALDSNPESVVIGYPVDEPLGYDAIVSFVKERLPADDDFVVLGESFSSPVAIRLASEGLPGLRGVVLCGGFASNPRPGLAGLAPLLPLLPFHGSTASVARDYLLGVEDDGLRQQVQRAIASVTADVIRHRLREVVSLDVRAQLQGITLPLLYLQAGNDRLVPASSANEIGRLLPAAEVTVIDGPHLLLQTRAPQCAKAIQAFIANC